MNGLVRKKEEEKFSISEKKLEIVESAWLEGETGKK